MSMSTHPSVIKIPDFEVPATFVAYKYALLSCWEEISCDVLTLFREIKLCVQKALQKTFATSRGTKSFAQIVIFAKINFRQIDGICP